MSAIITAAATRPLPSFNRNRVALLRDMSAFAGRAVAAGLATAGVLTVVTLMLSQQAEAAPPVQVVLAPTASTSGEFYVQAADGSYRRAPLAGAEVRVAEGDDGTQVTVTRSFILTDAAKDAVATAALPAGAELVNVAIEGADRAFHIHEARNDAGIEYAGRHAAAGAYRMVSYAVPGVAAGERVTVRVVYLQPAAAAVAASESKRAVKIAVAPL